MNFVEIEVQKLSIKDLFIAWVLSHQVEPRFSSNRIAMQISLGPNSEYMPLLVGHMEATDDNRVPELPSPNDLFVDLIPHIELSIHHKEYL
jgi:hypothetical protein